MNFTPQNLKFESRVLLSEAFFREGSGQNLAETRALVRRALFVVNCVFSGCCDGCNFMDIAFCVEKGGWRRGVGWKDCLHGTRRAAELDLH